MTETPHAADVLARFVQTSQESSELAQQLLARLDEIESEAASIRAVLRHTGHLPSPEDPRAILQALLAAGKVSDLPIVGGILAMLLRDGEMTASRIVSEFADSQNVIGIVAKPSTIHTALHRLTAGGFLEHVSPKKGSPYRVTSTGRNRFKSIAAALLQGITENL